MAGWNASILGLSGLAGAAGVGLAAVAAHLAGGQNLFLAAAFLLLHAAAAAALTAAGPISGPRGVALLVTATLILAGAILFSGDLALRGLANKALHTAPFGGSVAILGWLTLVAAAFLRSY
jgi:uncharacterized membrane protein YgdD (TMEM256/DUF423 family)